MQKLRDILCTRKPAQRAGKGIPCIVPRLALALLLCADAARASGTAPAPSGRPLDPTAVQAPVVGSLYIREYRVVGAHELKPLQIEEAVYPFLGPGRTPEDVEQARVALEKTYRDKGYQAVSVQIPPQKVRSGVVVLQVFEGTVAKLRVKGSRFYSPEQIRRQAGSLAEGRVIDFNDVTRDIVALNQLPDRQVSPSLRAGTEPGTADVDLTVQDKLPLHGSLELNNRYSPDTVPLRLNGAISYNNLFQLGHSIGFSFQIAPEDPAQVKVFSTYYLLRLPEVTWLSFLLQGTKQDSNVSTLGGGAVAGNGNTIGARALFSLPPAQDFYHSFNFGMDYKNYAQDVLLGGGMISSPITYYPFTASYSAAWARKGATTELNAGLIFSFRGLGSSESEFATRRYLSSGNFFFFRGDIAHTHDLPGGFQIFGKMQGQASPQPLPDSEEFSAGGLSTVRGYLEGEVLGDNAIFGTLEFITPSLAKWFGGRLNDWRFFVFGEGGGVSIDDPLPEQISSYELASVGVGTRFRIFDHVNGSLDLGVPLITQTYTTAGHPLLTFRVWADF